MKLAVIFLSLLWVLGMAAARADQLTASVQQTLKDQGFYYGEITGQRDADTTAAIRRYQIRNGLQITGELNSETQKSLGLSGASATATPAAAPARPVPTSADTSDLRAAPATPDQFPDNQNGTFAPQNPPASVYPPASPGVSGGALFEGTPYETAPPDLQRRVIVGTQSLLAQRGYYRSGIDGVFGGGTEFALRAFQARFGIEPTGRLDMETLAALGLLPGQQAPGVTAPTRRVLRPRPSFLAPRGERIYIPRRY